MPIALMQDTDRKKCIHTIFERLADADQQAGGKRNILLSRFFDRAQALGRKLIGGIVVGSAAAKRIGGSSLVSRRTNSHMASRYCSVDL